MDLGCSSGKVSAPRRMIALRKTRAWLDLAWLAIDLQRFALFTAAMPCRRVAALGHWSDHS